MEFAKYYSINNNSFVNCHGHKIFLEEAKAIIVNLLSKLNVSVSLKEEVYADCMTEVPVILKKAERSRNDHTKKNIYGYLKVSLNRSIKKSINENRPVRGSKRLQKFSSHKTISIDTNLTNENELELEKNSREDFVKNAEEFVVLKEQSFLLSKAIEKCLSKAELNIINKRYLDENKITLQAIANQEGVSKQRIAQKEKAILKKLKKELLLLKYEYYV